MDISLIILIITALAPMIWMAYLIISTMNKTFSGKCAEDLEMERYEVYMKSAKTPADIRKFTRGLT